MQPHPVTLAPEADAVASTDAAPDAAREGQATDEKTSPSSDSDRDDDAGKRKRKRDELSSNDGDLKEAKKEATSAGNDSDDTSKKEEEEKDAPVIPLTAFPQGCQQYVLHRLAGGEVLQHVEGSNMTGFLEIDHDNESAMFWAKCPTDRRIDSVSPHGQEPTLLLFCQCL